MPLMRVEDLKSATVITCCLKLDKIIVTVGSYVTHIHSKWVRRVNDAPDTTRVISEADTHDYDFNLHSARQKQNSCRCIWETIERNVSKTKLMKHLNCKNTKSNRNHMKQSHVTRKPTTNHVTSTSNYRQDIFHRSRNLHQNSNIYWCHEVYF